MVLDVAHNPAGAWALRSALSENFSGRELTIVFAAMRDKALQEMAEILFPIAEQVDRDAELTIRARPPPANCCRPPRVPERRFTEEQSVAAALARAREVSKPQGLIVVTGSIFLVGEAMSAMGIPA